MDSQCCQQCATLAYYRFLPIVDATVIPAPKAGFEHQVWVWVECPGCGVKMIGYVSYFANLVCAQDQRLRMLWLKTGD